MSFSSEWVIALGSIVFINLILSGDNAVLIALAGKNLAEEQRRKAILVGSIGAVVLRIILTFIAAYLLDIPYLQFFGGMALIWIAINLWGKGDKEATSRGTYDFIQAIKTILVADLIMSLDNVLALAAISQTVPSGKYSLIIIGLVTSIPLVVFGAQALMKLMDRYPIIIGIGVGVLGYAAAEMIIGDKAIGPMIASYKLLFEIGLTFSVILIAYWKKTNNKKIIKMRDMP
ncbi:YjbE family integral membrane protein [Sporomusaceae bacterium BoRhaA]|uniref:TerC family protein n=1 Tax=Pelorhabdus rhamnosifermentans TaxID=2772457 RepID=UPI001C060F82|nr:TerC family protein [Pelorhabdus rhamnosifermentans]MBU2703612.1 YjbE family integral membrane protein [Pelorhabdus rhamnosifermentans]